MLSDYPLKTGCYKHSLVYMKHMVTKNQNSIQDLHEKLKRKKKPNITLQRVINIQDIRIREQENREELQKPS